MRRGQTAADSRNQTEPALSLLDDLPTEPICVRVATAVKLTGIPRSTLYELISSGEVETKKLGRSTFVLYASLKRLFERD